MKFKNNKIVKRSELENIIREEIKNALSEDDEIKGGEGAVEWEYEPGKGDLTIRVGKEEITLGKSGTEGQTIFDLKNFLNKYA